MELHPLQIIKPRPDNTISVNEDALHSILTKPEIKDRYVSIISITGPFRQGKSFLLNFFLRYLKIKYVEKKNVTEWLNPVDGPLKGFSWAPGSKRHTNGIVMWPEIFLTETPTKEKVAIILLDTQGSFDNESGINDCAAIFGLSTLISSIQIYNVMRGIKQYDLSHLQCFGGYASLMTDAEKASFQNLYFLVRDWPCPYEHQYGEIGGSAMLGEVLHSENAELRAQIENVQQLFKKINCFLLPYPGRTVDASDLFKGYLCDIDDIFKEHAKDFVELLLSPEKLTLKTVDGVKVQASDLLHYIQEYSKVLHNGTLPKIQTIFKATVEAQHKAAALRAFKLYKRNMSFEVGHAFKSLTETDLYDTHGRYEVKSVQYYTELKKMEDEAAFDKYLLILKDIMGAEYKNYRILNDDKKKRYEESKKKMAEKIRLTHSSEAGSSLALCEDITKKVGITAGIIGGVAVLAFGASKLFSKSRGNGD